MSTIRIGLMGFGRIGRNVFRIVHDTPGLRIQAICDLMPFDSLAYLARWDTLHGPFPDSVERKDNSLFVRGQEIKLFQEQRPEDVPWRDLGVDVVIDATNAYRKKEQLEGHLKAGAKRVVLTATPEENEDIDIIVMGVNDDKLNENTKIVSIGSVTINCIAPVLKILDDEFGIEHASLTSVHAYTNAQRLADVPTADFRSSRSAAENIIPQPTSAAQSIGRVLPNLEGKLCAVAINVPIPDGSITDLVSCLKKEVDVESVNLLFKSAAGSRKFQNIIQVADDAIVSSDVIGNPHSVIFDSLATRVLGGNLIKTLGWFDNGWGFASRAIELTEKLSRFDQ